MVARGLSNANPGNIRRSKEAWQGLAQVQTDSSFFTFKTPVWGIRAIARILITYQDEHNCHNISDIISRWAPPKENNTEAYIADVCKRSGFQPLDQLNMHEHRYLKPLVNGIIWHENGSNPYSDAVIDEALKLAGVVPEASQSTVAALAKDPKVIATTIAATAASAQATVSSVSNIWDGLSHMGIDPRYIIWAAVAVGISLVVYFALDRFYARKEGRT